MICEMCGEDIEEITCPFCMTVQSEVPSAPTRKSKKIKSVNIKEDLPTAETAISRLRVELKQASEQGCKALKVIHGYGSSGKGGDIKREVHRFLMSCEGISSWFPGEDFSAQYQDTLEVLRRYPFLESDKDFRRSTRGITMVIF